LIKFEEFPICPDCDNNLCLLYPAIFAEKHLKGADKRWYESKKKDIEKMAEHKDKISCIVRGAK